MARIGGKDAAEWGSALLVAACGAAAGHYAAAGMSLLQGTGAAAAVLGSVTLAVCVRVWPAERARAQAARD
ncbi:hypothetical protein [Phenylobacterium sp.]|uniref:hypothetical protein n=1 Tax=Phenylobacterium sp. TaxID=1871053 RepID=UPI003983B40E